MATLHLRNVPPDVDATLAAEARARGVSKNRRVIEALRRGLGLDQVERSQLVDRSVTVGGRSISTSPS